MVGMYLLTIAVADVRFGKRYCKQQVEWLTSPWCSGMGMLSTIGYSLSSLSMTTLSLVRITGIMSGMKVPSEINKKVVFKISLLLGILVGISTSIAIVPILPNLENYFVNGIGYSSSIRLFIGLVGKREHNEIFRSYYGKLKYWTLSWDEIKKLVDGMFTSDYSVISRRKIEFYGNDPVCLFKYFVQPDDPQKLFVWSILGLNFLCFLLITVSYSAINIVSRRSSKSAGGHKNSIVRVCSLNF